MSYLIFDELIEGRDVYVNHYHEGVVKYLIVQNNGEVVKMESTSISGYFSEFTREDYNQALQKENTQPLYRSYDDAVEMNKIHFNKRIDEFVDKFKDDREKFFKEVVEIAIAWESDPEFGDQAEAIALQKLADIHHPGK